MEMTKRDIIKSYREAKDKKKQIYILAQLNLTTPEVISGILVEAGFMEANRRISKSKNKIKKGIEEPSTSIITIGMQMPVWLL